MRALLLDFQFAIRIEHSEMSNKGITVVYAEFITSLSIHKGTVDINQKNI